MLLAVLTGIPCLIAFAVWILNITSEHTRFDQGFIIPVLAAFVIFEAVSGFFQKKAGQTGAGVRGEKASVSLLSGLPDHYTVIPNFQLAINGRETEIDQLVVGDNGIFIVETKNYRGTLYGDISDRELVKEKFARENTYSQGLRNPVFQVKREIAMLKEYLRSNGCDHYVHGMVYYANCDFRYEVRGEDPYVSVFLAADGGEYKLLDTIRSNVDRAMTPEKKEQILRCLHG